MKKFINYNYKYVSSNIERAKLIKEIGFNGVFIYSQYNPNNYIMDILNCGLEIETLHLPYKLIKNDKCVDSQFVNVIWTSKSEANDYMEELIEQIKFAHNFGIKNVVMHVTGGDTPPPINTIGIIRIQKLLEYCDKYDINLCLENLRRLDYLKYLFENIYSSKLKFCFDSGHANYMTKNIQNFPWECFGEKLFCLHLNDNDKTRDTHSIPFTGDINWKKLMKTILFYNSNINLTLEVRASKEYLKTISEYDFLKTCYDSLLKLENLK